MGQFVNYKPLYMFHIQLDSIKMQKDIKIRGRLSKVSQAL